MFVSEDKVVPRSLTHTLTHSLLTHSLLIHSLIHTPNYSPTHSPTHVLTHSPTHPLAHSLTHPLTHPPTHSPTHSLAPYLSCCRCQEALDLNKQLITEEQQEYQHELVRNFRDFQNKLEPMVPTKKKHKRSR